MNNPKDPLANQKVDHLILLVGGNPLPNAVSGKLLCNPSGTITLLHSNGKHGTFNIAQNLQNWFVKQGFKPATLISVQESDADSIMLAMQNALKNIPYKAKVGLNYTGGTKAMAVHAYRAMESWATKQHITPLYSYLDARTLSLIIDPPHPEQGKLYVGRRREIKLDDLLKLHSWSWQEPPIAEPFLPLISEALHQVYLDENALCAWETWKHDVLISKCSRDNDREKWQSQGRLRKISLPWPADPLLKSVTLAMQQELGNSNDQLNLADAATRCSYKEIEKICTWLKGGYWLETVVFQALDSCKTQSNLHDISMNLKPSLTSGTNFEFDVVALRGYQLFAFSCSTDTDSPKNKGGKARLKKRLFEAYIRARQMGGDEARVALVCCAEKPYELELEMYRTLDTEGRIKVFGQEHLDDLTEYIQTWIKEQSNEEVK